MHVSFYMNFNFEELSEAPVNGERSMITRSSRGAERNRENSARYERWNYLQPRPISYQKAIKSFRDLEITSTPDRFFFPGEWSTSPSAIPPSPASAQLRERCVRLRAFFSFHFQHFSSDRPSPSLGRRRPLPASSVKTRSTETFPGKILRLLSRAIVSTSDFFFRAFDSIGYSRHDQKEIKAFSWICRSMSIRKVTELNI